MHFYRLSQEFIEDRKQNSFWDVDKLIHFRKTFGVVGYDFGAPSMPIPCFARMLRCGSRVRARNSEYSWGYVRSDYTYYLFDHSLAFKLKTGQVIWVAMPYPSRRAVIAKFAKMCEEYSFPDTVKLAFMDDKYKFRSNGDYMLVIYDNTNYDFNPAQ